MNGNSRANAILVTLNGIFEDLDEYSLYEDNGFSNVVFENDARIRFELFSDPSINSTDVHGGVFYHPAAPTTMNELTYAASIANQRQYENVLNIVFYDDNPDVPSSCGAAALGCMGVHSGGSLIRNMLSTNTRIVEGTCDGNIWGSWEWARILSHELGHGFGLCHSHNINSECSNEFVDDGVNPLWECSGFGGTVAQELNNCGGNNNSNPCEPGASNNIMSNGTGVGSLTKCQWKVMYRNLIEGSAGFFDTQGERTSVSDLCEVIETPLVISDNETWQHLKIIQNRTVIIPTGAKLNIENCQVRMIKDANIVVERGAVLEMDNSSIVNLCNGERWGGIYVEGNNTGSQSTSEFSQGVNQAGILDISDCSLVHGSTAIHNYKLNESWNADYRGGYIYAQDVSFIDNRRGAAFLRYDKTDNSSFENCNFIQTGTGTSEFSNSGRGVSVWKCYGINFIGNTFSNHEYGILSYDAGLNISTGNNINNCDVGLDIYSTHPNSSHDEVGTEGLEANVFESNQIHIQINAGNEGGETNITNNNFLSSGYGNAAIWVEGRHEASVDNNVFNDNTAAMVVRDTEYGICSFECNIVTNGEIGFIAQGQNDGFVFNANEFNSDLVDGSISSSGNLGSIHHTQGFIDLFDVGEWKSASNSFSSANNIDIATLNDAETIPFNYVVPALATNDFEPDGNGNYAKFFVEKEEEECEDIAIDNGLIGKPPYEFGDLINVRSIKSTAEIAYNANPDDANIKIDYEKARRTKEKVLSWLTANAVKTKNYDLAESYLVDELSKSSQKSLYGIKVLKADYTAATVKLNELPQDTPADIEYKQLQLINLSWLQSQLPPDANFGNDEGDERDESFVSTGGFRLTSEESELLYSIAHSNSTNRSTARSLLAVLKGERFINSLNIEDIRADVNEKYPKNSETTKVISVFPNPAQDYITIEGITETSTTNTFVELVSLTGEVVLSKKITPSEDNVSIDLRNSLSGVYILTLKRDKHIMHYEKIVIFK